MFHDEKTFLCKSPEPCLTSATSDIDYPIFYMIKCVIFELTIVIFFLQIPMNFQAIAMSIFLSGQNSIQKNYIFSSFVSDALRGSRTFNRIGRPRY